MKMNYSCSGRDKSTQLLTAAQRMALLLHLFSFEFAGKYMQTTETSFQLENFSTRIVDKSMCSRRRSLVDWQNGLPLGTIGNWKTSIRGTYAPLTRFALKALNVLEVSKIRKVLKIRSVLKSYKRWISCLPTSIHSWKRCLVFRSLDSIYSPNHVTTFLFLHRCLMNILVI